MDSEQKNIKQYSKMYKEAISRRGLEDVNGKVKAYEEKLAELYSSRQYKNFDIYPSIDMHKVYAVIAMCLILKNYGLEKDDIINIVNDAFRKLKKAFGCIEKIIDLSPLAWNIAKKWNLSDHENRVKDGSITYDYFNVEDNRISYGISKCMYADIFEHYGIREYCKIFCMSDTQAYANLTKHVEFVRYSDLSDGESCRDVIAKKERK